MARTIKINQVDAFTDKLFGGNPAAVVLDANDLSDEEMKQIAREMNLSETAFVLDPTLAGADFKLRYFTLAMDEIKFCGHATVGALFELALEGYFGMEADGEYPLQVETNAGVLKMLVKKEGDEIIVEFAAPEIELVEYKQTGSEVAARLGIPEEAISQAAPIMLEKNLNYLYITIKDIQALADLKFDFEKIVSSFKNENIVVFCLLCAGGIAEGTDIHARGLAPLVGVPEDPVTGSMQGALAAYAKLNGLIPATQNKLKIEQGHFIGRPGNLRVNIEEERGKYSANVVATAKHVFSTTVTL